MLAYLAGSPFRLFLIMRRSATGMRFQNILTHAHVLWEFAASGFSQAPQVIKESIV